MLAASEIKAIQTLSDPVLIEKIETLIKTEREVTLALLHHLREMDRRKLFGSHGSLFSYLRAQGYDGGSAQRRIDAMRLLTDFPEVEEKIACGELNLTVAAQAETFFRQEAKALEQPLAREERREVLESLFGKSTREVERELLRRSAQPEVHFQEKVKAASETHSEMKMLVTDEVVQDLETLKGLLSHKYPHLSYGELVGVIAKIALEKLNPAREPKRRGKAPKELPAPEVLTPKVATKLPALEVTALAPRKRMTLRAKVKRTVYQRDGSACDHRDPKTGERCGSRYFLELHHVKPWALGGTDSIENLVVRCRNHNQRYAYEDFGVRSVRRIP